MVLNTTASRPHQKADLTRYSLLDPGSKVLCLQSLTGFILRRGQVILLWSFSVTVLPIRYFADTQFRSTRSKAHSSSCNASRCVAAAWMAPDTGSVTTCSLHAVLCNLGACYRPKPALPVEQTSCTSTTAANTSPGRYDVLSGVIRSLKAIGQT